MEEGIQMIDIFNKSYEPTIKEINDFVGGGAKKRWLDIQQFIIDNYQAKMQTSYSRCSAMPGWNVKYKKSGKAVCTLYPREDYYAILIVLNEEDMEWFKGIRNGFTDHVLNRYDNSGMMNGTKWVMIDVSDDEILNDVKGIIKLKMEK
jgi:hypothetical protein